MRFWLTSKDNSSSCAILYCLVKMLSFNHPLRIREIRKGWWWKNREGFKTKRIHVLLARNSISSWVTILRTLQMSVRTGHGIKYWYKDFSWLLKHLNILIKIIGMSIRSIIELHSNPDFLVDTSIILCHQKFSWFQTKGTKFNAIIPTFKI